MGPLKPKMVTFRHDADPPKLVKYSFSMSNRLQHLIIGTEDGHGSKREVRLRVHPL